MLNVVVKVHPLGVCSHEETVATGFHMYWVETQGLHPHPLGTTSVCVKDKRNHCKTAVAELKAKRYAPTSYLTNSFYIEVFPLTIKKFFILSKQR